MRRSVSMTLAASLLATPLVLTTPSPVVAGDKTDGPTPVTLTRWTSDADFQRGEREGLAVQGGSLALDGTASLPSTTYTDPFGAGTARSYDVGTWTSSVVEVDYPIDQAISSWNAITPTGTWVETSFRGRYLDGTWSKWYVLGRWTSGMQYPADIHRTSLNGQGDTDGTVLTDTFASRKKRKPVAFQTRVALLRPTGTTATPRLDAVTTMSSAAYPEKLKSISEFTLGEHVELAVPPYAQNTHSGEFPDFGGGGEVWCSPTSSAMVMALLRRLAGRCGAGRHSVRRPAGRPRRTPCLGLRLRRSGKLAVQRGLRAHLRTGLVRDPAALAGRGGAVRRGGHPRRRVTVLEAE